MLILFDDNEIFREYTIMIELYNALKFMIMLFFNQKILTFILGVAFLKSVSIFVSVETQHSLCRLVIFVQSERLSG